MLKSNKNVFFYFFREDGMSSVDIKSETDSLRPDSPKCQDSLLNSKFTKPNQVFKPSLIVVKGD